MKITGEDLRNRFNYHPPKSLEVAALHESVRTHCIELAAFLVNVIPEGRAASLAITYLEETMMWANAAIARHQE